MLGHVLGSGRTSCFKLQGEVSINGAGRMQVTVRPTATSPITQAAFSGGGRADDTSLVANSRKSAAELTGFQRRCCERYKQPLIRADIYPQTAGGLPEPSLCFHGKGV